MKKSVDRSVQWLQPSFDSFEQMIIAGGNRPRNRMNGNRFRTIKEFAVRTDERTQVVTSISARSSGPALSFRVATLREHAAGDGVVRRSPWLGMRELMLKAKLEKQALDFIAVEVAKRRDFTSATAE